MPFASTNSCPSLAFAAVSTTAAAPPVVGEPVVGEPVACGVVAFGFVAVVELDDPHAASAIAATATSASSDFRDFRDFNFTGWFTEHLQTSDPQQLRTEYGTRHRLVH